MIEPTIVLLEDDAELRTLVSRALREDGFAVRALGNATGLLAVDGFPSADAFVMDIGLPDADGRDVVQALRARGCHAPVIFLTARDGLSDRLAGFAAGGDDYLVKPFAIAELIARLRALVRRGGRDGVVVFEGLRIDPVSHRAGAGGEEVELTPTEFRLLARLAANPGEAVRRRELVLAGWPPGATVHDNSLDVYIARLRRKLAELPGAPSLTTVHGVGYALR